VKLTFSCVMNDMHVMLDSDVLDDGCILSDHFPILVECTVTASICNSFRPPVATTAFRRIAWLRSPSCVGIMLISHLIATCVNFTLSQYYNNLLTLRVMAGVMWKI